MNFSHLIKKFIDLGASHLLLFPDQTRAKINGEYKRIETEENPFNLFKEWLSENNLKLQENKQFFPLDFAGLACHKAMAFSHEGALAISIFLWQGSANSPGFKPFYQSFLTEGGSLGLLVSPAQGGKTSLLGQLIAKSFEISSKSYPLLLSECPMGPLGGRFHKNCDLLSLNKQNDWQELYNAITARAPSLVFIDLPSWDWKIENIEKIKVSGAKVILNLKGINILEGIWTLSGQNSQKQKNLCQYLDFAISSHPLKGANFATEVVVFSKAIRTLFAENRLHQLKQAVQVGTKMGMVSVEQQLKALLMQKKLNQDDYQKECRVSANHWKQSLAKFID